MVKHLADHEQGKLTKTPSAIDQPSQSNGIVINYLPIEEVASSNHRLKKRRAPDPMKWNLKT